MKDVNILVEALPYIKKFHEKKILIKYGGHAMIDEDAMSSTVRDTVLFKICRYGTTYCSWWRSGNI